MIPNYKKILCCPDRIVKKPKTDTHLDNFISVKRLIIFPIIFIGDTGPNVMKLTMVVIY